MSAVVAELEAKIRLLNADEKAELIRFLIAELDGPADDDVEEAWRLEIERRVGQVERGEVQPVPGDEVFARLRQRFR